MAEKQVRVYLDEPGFSGFSGSQHAGAREGSADFADATHAPAPACKHYSRDDEWVSAQHAEQCLGVPREALLEALYAGDVRWRTAGKGYTLQVFFLDLCVHLGVSDR